MDTSNNSGAQLSSLAYTDSGALYERFQKAREACGQKRPFPVRKARPEEVKTCFLGFDVSSIISHALGKLRNVCPVLADETQLSLRAKEVKSVSDTFVKLNANQKKMLNEVYKTLTDSERAAEFHVAGAVRELLDERYPYGALMAVLGVPGDVIDELRTHRGDLTRIPEEKRESVIKALIVLATETNTLKSVQFEGDDAPVALARAVHTAIARSGIVHAETMENVLLDEEQSEQFFGELLGNPGYRDDLTAASYRETYNRGYDALSAIGQNEKARRAMTTLLSRIYQQRYFMLQDVELPEALDPPSEDMTMEELAIALKYKMGIDLPSIILLSAHLCVVDKDYISNNPDSEQTDFGVLSCLLRNNNPLIADLMIGPTEDDKDVEFSPCRKYHASAFHETGYVEGKEGSDDAMRVSTYLYMRGGDVDRNRLINKLIEQGSGAQDNEAISKVLKVLCERGVIVADDDNKLGPDADFNGDFVLALCAALETSGSVVALYKALRAIGNEEVMAAPEGAGYSARSAVLSHGRCVRNAKIMASTMEAIVSAECHSQFFKASLTERSVGATPVSQLFVVPVPASEDEVVTLDNAGTPVTERTVGVITPVFQHLVNNTENGNNDSPMEVESTTTEVPLMEDGSVDSDGGVDDEDSASSVSDTVYNFTPKDTRDEVERLANKTWNLNQDLESLQTDYNASQEQVAALQKKVSEFEAGAGTQEEKSSELEALKAEMETLKRDAAMARALAESKDETLRAKSDSMAEFEQTLDQLANEQVVLQETVTAKEEECAQLKGELDINAAKAKDLQARLEDSQRTIAELRAKVNTGSTEDMAVFEAQLKTMEESRVRLEGELAKEAADAVRVQGELEDAENQVADLNARLKANNAHIETLQDKVSALESEKAALAEREADALSKQSESENLRLAAEQKLADEVVAKEKLQKELERLKKQPKQKIVVEPTRQSPRLREARAKIAELQALVKEQNLQLAEVQKKDESIASLEATLATLKQSHKEVTERLSRKRSMSPSSMLGSETRELETSPKRNAIEVTLDDIACTSSQQMTMDTASMIEAYNASTVNYFPPQNNDVADVTTLDEGDAC